MPTVAATGVQDTTQEFNVMEMGAMISTSASVVVLIQLQQMIPPAIPIASLQCELLQLVRLKPISVRCCYEESACALRSSGIGTTSSSSYSSAAGVIYCITARQALGAVAVFIVTKSIHSK